MTTIELSSTVGVELIDSMGSDLAIVQAAQVSLKGQNNPDNTPEKVAGLIRYLMKSRHGSPFEHVVMKFYVTAPIFVFREWHRHRIASYNEMSGRYTKLLPKFYSPAPERPLRNVGSSARPEFAPGTSQQYADLVSGDEFVCQAAWNEYEGRLADGIANEVARTVLPVSTYSQMYVTANLRSWLNFLSLRTDDERAAVRSRPQYEIALGAREVERELEQIVPLAMQAFNEAGRVAP